MESNNSHFLYTAGIRFNRVTGEVSVPGDDAIDSFRLSPVNRKVLDALIKAQGQSISRADLFDQVWPNQEVSDDALTRSISDLRAQLKPLAHTSPLINTIPKVGYRWLPEIENPAVYQTPESLVKQRFIPVLSAFILLILVLMLLMYFLTSKSQQNTTGVIVLPTENDGGLNLATCLKQASNKHETIRYLSNHAFQAHTGNPYPFFAHEFGVRWFIASSVDQIEQETLVFIDLIDARTGLVILSETYPIKNTNNLSDYCDSFLNTITLTE